MPSERLDSVADEFAWVEARIPQSQLPTGWLGPTNGFQCVDLQLGYRASLRGLVDLPTGTTITPVTSEWIDTDDFAPFGAERYSRLPGVTATRLAHRYSLWANDLMAASPAGCVTVTYRGRPAGYVFGSASGTRASFTLAVSSQASTAPGLVIYLAAAHHFRAMGATSMASSLSATNLGALNAHVALGCTFTTGTSVWLRA